MQSALHPLSTKVKKAASIRIILYVLETNTITDEGKKVVLEGTSVLKYRVYCDDSTNLVQVRDFVEHKTK